MATRPLPRNRIPGAERVLGSAQVQARDDVRAVLLDAARRIGLVLTRYAGADGKINRRNRADVLREAGEIITRVFVGRDGRSAFDRDGVTPLSPYALALNLALAQVQHGAVRIQGEWLKKHAPDDVWRWLAQGRPRQPVVAEQTRREELIAAYRELLVDTGNLGYDAAHTFVGDDGYTLSDRIWRAGNVTRAKIDQFISDGITSGIGAFELAKKLEQFLTPGRAALRTNKPYGVDASYDAMRLARTEITAAFGRATMAAARANPYVIQVWWKLSPSHPKPDICDTYEAGSPWTLNRVPAYPAHPQCVTPGQLVITTRGWLPIEDVRAGDEVLTHNARFRAVTDAWERHYEGLVYEIETDAGCFELTSEHPVMTLCGWVNAESIEPGDQILYTGNHIGLDLALDKAECSPSLTEQMLIADSVSCGIVPVFAIALDGDFKLWQGEIKNVSSNRILFLSSLHPGDCVGAAPRNAVVERVANPLQAHAHYNTVRAVRVRRYDGPVYNMEVEADHSYTVNGAAVHNCLCALIPLAEQVPDKVSRELQALMVDAQSNLRPYLNPAQIDDFTRYLIGDVLNGLMRQRGQLQIMELARIVVPF